MSEGTIMEMVKWFIYLLLTVMMIGLTVFLIQLGSINTFKQQVNYQIERKGGLTEDAMAVINEYSEEQFNGRFSVDSDLINTKVSYGEAVNYTVNGVFDIVILPIPDVHLTFSGTGVSQVR